MNIRVIAVTDNALCKQHPRQNTPQPRYVQLDLERGLMTAGCNTDVGNAIPSAVYQGRILRWPILAIAANDVNAMMGRLLPIAEIIHAEYGREWNGNNFVGKYTETGWEAIQEIRNMLDLYTSFREIR